MVITLTVIKGEDEGKVFSLAEGETKSVGRGSRCGVPLTEAGVSRQHCQVRAEGDVCVLMDLGSRNGTMANGLKVSGEVRLVDGDVIDVGSTRIRVDVHSTPAPIAAMEPVASASEGIAVDDSVRAAANAASVSTVTSPSRVGPGHLIGQLIGGCLAEQVIGQDESGEIYRATQVSMERTVLLRVLDPARTNDAQSVERFIQAARTGGKLSHPNIVQVYDAGTDQGVYFIALERVEGKSLQELLDERGKDQPLPMRTATEIIVQIADALDYAHAQGTLHRHVTPQHIVVAEHGLAKLADLGFARGLAEAGLAAASSPAERLADLPFIAPEALADPRAASAASDIYSLGVVLFMAVTGQKAFCGKTESEILDRVRKGAHLSARALRRDLPDELALIIERAMAVAPKERFARASEMQHALRKVRDKVRA